MPGKKACALLQGPLTIDLRYFRCLLYKRLHKNNPSIYHKEPEHPDYIFAANSELVKIITNGFGQRKAMIVFLPKLLDSNLSLAKEHRIGSTKIFQKPVYRTVALLICVEDDLEFHFSSLYLKFEIL